MAVDAGFEPTINGSKPFVIPLHQSTILSKNYNERLNKILTNFDSFILHYIIFIKLDDSPIFWLREWDSNPRLQGMNLTRNHSSIPQCNKTLYTLLYPTELLNLSIKIGLEPMTTAPKALFIIITCCMCLNSINIITKF